MQKTNNNKQEGNTRLTDNRAVGNKQERVTKLHVNTMAARTNIPTCSILIGREEQLIERRTRP